MTAMLNKMKETSFIKTLENMSQEAIMVMILICFTIVVMMTLYDMKRGKK